MSNEPIANPHEMRYLCDVIINEGVAYLPQWIYADQITELQQQLATLREQKERWEALAVGRESDWEAACEREATLRDDNERLRAALVEHATAEEWDMPGDTPIVVGHSCLICKAEAATPEAIRHAEGCPLKESQ